MSKRASNSTNGHAERTRFYRLMKWFLPLFLTTALAFYIYKTTQQVGPIEGLKAGMVYLREANSKSEAKIEDLQERVLRLEETGRHAENVESNRHGNSTFSGVMGTKTE